MESFSSIPGSSFEWIGPSGFTSSASNPEITEAGLYELTVQSPNGCETISNVTVEADTDVPFVTIESDTLGCAPDTIMLESFSSIAGSSYDWTGPGGFTSQVSNPEITEAGLYELTVQSPNGCETISSITVEADTDVPFVTIENDTLGCAPDTIILESFSSIPGSIFEWTGPSGFTSSASNPEITEAGLYELTVRSPNGCETISNVTVEADTDVPLVTIESDTLGCAPDTIILESFSSIFGSSFEWTGPSGFTSSASNPEITEAGLYELTVQSPNGCETISSITVEADTDVPFVTIENDTLGCAPDTIILESFSSIPGSSFEWIGPNGFTSSASNPEITEAGLYELTVQSPNGCFAIDTIEVVENLEIPIVTTLGDTIDCTNDPLQLQSFVNQNNVDYLWSGPNTFVSTEQNPMVFQSGNYNLLVTGENGCTASVTATVLDLSDNVTASVLVTDSLDCTTTVVLIDGSNSSSGINISYLWLDESNLPLGQNNTLDVSIAGLYTLIVNDSITSCFDTLQIQVAGDTITPFVNLNPIGAQSITCENTSVTLSADGSGPLGEIAFEWFYNGNSFSTLSEIEVENSGEYVLQITNLLNNCVASDTLLITQNTDIPDVQILPPDEINCLDTIIVIDASGSSSGTEYIYQWTSSTNSGILSGQNEPLLFVNEQGEYTLVISNQLTGCVDSFSIIVNADQEYPIATASVNEELDCFNQSLTINGTGSSTGSVFEYLWSGANILDGGESLNPLVNQTGIYTLSVNNTENGCVSEFQIEVEGSDDFITGMEVFSLDPSCYEENDGSILIESIAGGTAPFTYSIDTLVTSFNSFENLVAGTYSISVVDAVGCSFDTVVILEQAVPIGLNLGDDQWIQLGDSFSIEPLMNVFYAELDTFYWMNLDQMPCDTCFEQWVMPLQTTLYELTVVNENGCVDTDDLLIHVEKDRLVFVPNVFSPNDDGLNDFFTIFTGQDVATIRTFQVFDRWGEILFRKEDFIPNDPPNGWDGTFKNEPLNPGVFIYFAEVEFIDGRVEIYKGDFTLIR